MLIRGSRVLTKRSFHSLKIASEVRDALATGNPVVSLESTIITHGLPFPQNIKMALAVEDAIRKAGVVPATTAFIDGIPRVGLSPLEIEQLAEYANRGQVNKVSRRDIAYTMAHKLQGGTTISSSMILSHLSKIKVFATGGLGGVHRGGELSMDVSADLEELGRTPVAVVCAGPKAILDIDRTMEYLETKGCMVATMGPVDTNVPGFYTRDSGVKSPYNFQTFREAAQIVNEGNYLGLNSGYLFCIPPPEESALDSAFISQIINDADLEASNMGINGKELTPFLLSQIAQKTKGLSVQSNIEFVLNNARAGAEISKELSLLEKGLATKTEVNSIPGYQPSELIGLSKKKSGPSTRYSVVIGSIAMDSHCCISGSLKMKDSNPGTIQSTIGGVGHNVALAAHLSNRSPDTATRLVTAVGNDLSGSAILQQMQLDNKGVYVDKHNPTAQYISVHSNDGDLVVACADMGIATKIPLEHVEEQIMELKPKVVLVDANVSIEVLNHLSYLQKKMGFKFVFEPTSQAKAEKVSKMKKLGIFPNNTFYLMTPTVAELQSIFDSFNKESKFDIDNWFPVIDSLQIDKTLGQISKQTRNPFFKELIAKGVFQMACYLIPFFPRIIVKDGANGIYVFTIEEDIQKFSSIESFADFSIVSKGLLINGLQTGVLFEHYKVPVKDVKIENVTGAGDTFIGVLLNEFCSDDDLFKHHGEQKFKSLNRAQLGSKLTIEDKDTISRKLTKLA